MIEKKKTLWIFIPAN